ncbi:MAG: hypothetical protein ABIN96_00085 [Rubrivivax sp.]
MLKELVRRSTWLAIGAAIGRFLPLLVLLLASRVMEPRQFASASAAYAWAGVGMSLTSMGLTTIMTRRLAASTGALAQQRVFIHHLRLSLGFSGALAALVLLFGQTGGGLIFGAAFDPVVTTPAALSAVLWAQVVLCVAALNGCHRAVAASVVLAACGLLQGGSMALAIAMGDARAVTLSWGLLCGSVLACGVAAALVWRALPWRRQGAENAREQDPEVAGAASTLHGTALAVAEVRVPLWRNHILWTSIASAAVMPVSFFASSLVAHGTDGVRQLAQYFALEQIHQLLIYLPAIVGQALLPMLSRSLSTVEGVGARSRLITRLSIASVLTAAAGLGLGAALAFQPGWFIGLLKNPALLAHDAWAVRWMVLNASLGASLAVLGGALIGSGLIVTAGVLNLAWAGVFLGLTAAWAGHGNTGLQAARLVASLLLLVMAITVLRRSTRLAAR